MKSSAARPSRLPAQRRCRMSRHFSPPRAPARLDRARRTCVRARQNLPSVDAGEIIGPFPAGWGGTSVAMTNAKGATTVAPLSFVSPTEITFEARRERREGPYHGRKRRAVCIHRPNCRNRSRSLHFERLWARRRQRGERLLWAVRRPPSLPILCRRPDQPGQWPGVPGSVTARV